MAGNIPGFLGGMCENKGCELKALYHLFGHDFCAICYAKYLAHTMYYGPEKEENQLSLF